MKSSNNKFIPYGRQTITEADEEAVIKVLRSEYITQGPTVNDFEEAFGKNTNAKYCVAVNSATSALHIACLALGLTDGDWLWTTPNTFVASANCGIYCGAKVDFVDINPVTGLMDLRKLKLKLEATKEPKKIPKIVIPVHLCGTSCEMKELKILSEKYKFRIIEDASHAIGAMYDLEPVGNCKYSSISVFSLHPVKIITSGEGGLATTNDPELAQKMRDLRSHGIIKDRKRFKETHITKPWGYEQQYLGFNYRLSDIQAALGLSQLSRIDRIIKERHEIYDNYVEMLKKLPLKFLKWPKKSRSSLHLAVIRLAVKDPQHHLNIFNGMREAKIGVQLHYSPVHLQPFYKEMGFREGDFKESEEYSKNAMSLPIYPGLGLKNQKRVVEELSKLLSQ